MGRELQSILLVLYRNGVRGSALLRYMITRISTYKRSYDIVLLRKELAKRLGKVATKNPKKYAKLRVTGFQASVRQREGVLADSSAISAIAVGYNPTTVGNYIGYTA